MNMKMGNIITVVIVVAGVSTGLLWQKSHQKPQTRFVRSIPAACNPDKPFSYPLDSLSVVDTSLIGYRQVAMMNLTIKNPRALCLDDADRRYVAGTGGIFRLDSSGSVDKTFATSGADVVNCIAVDQDGRIHAATKRQLVRYSVDGTQAAAWSIGDSDTYITSIAVDETTVFVADAGKRFVWCLDTAGKVINRIGEKDTARGIPGFIVPSPYMDCALGPDGSLWVVNTGRHSIENYRRNGDLLFNWGIPGTDIEGFCGCCNPIRFALMPDGSFVTAEKGIVRVKIYGPTGTFKTIVAAPAMFDPGLTGLALAVDSHGSIILLEMSNGRIRIFRAKAEASRNG